MDVLLLTSKGSAGVAGAGFVALAATLATMHKIPVSGLVLLLGVDRFLNDARVVTSLTGNGGCDRCSGSLGGSARYENGVSRARSRYRYSFREAALDYGEFPRPGKIAIAA